MDQLGIFISYSHKDESEKDWLLSHLGVLQHERLISLWSDDRISPGANWEQEISEAMAQARVAILLISANFLTSDFILGKEVPALLKRRESEGLTVFPVIAKACAWKKVEWLTKMNVRPKNGRPIWGSGQVDARLAAIAEEVAAIVKTNPHIVPTVSDVSEKFKEGKSPLIIDGPFTRLQKLALGCLALVACCIFGITAVVVYPVSELVLTNTFTIPTELPAATPTPGQVVQETSIPTATVDTNQTPLATLSPQKPIVTSDILGMDCGSGLISELQIIGPDNPAKFTLPQYKFHDYRFKLDRGQSVVFALNNDFKVNLEIYDAVSCETITNQLLYAPGNFDFIADESKYFFIRVQPVGPESGNYTLEYISQSSDIPTPTINEPPGSEDDVPSMNCGSGLISELQIIGSDNPAKFTLPQYKFHDYRFKLDRGQSVVFVLNNDFKARLEIYDAASCETITSQLLYAPGNFDFIADESKYFFIRVQPVGPESGNYTLEYISQ